MRGIGHRMRQGHSGAPPERRRRRRALPPVLVLGAAGAVAAVLLAGPFGGEPPASTRSTAPTGTAIVRQGKVSERISVGGTLTYAGGYEAVNRASGVYTDLPRAGEVYEAGRVLYRVDTEPVVYLKGSIPVFRDLEWGDRGRDVRQLNAALVALGHGSGLDADSAYFGYATYVALLRLEDDRGLTEDGKLSKGEVVYLPADRIRVTRLNVGVGDRAGGGTAVLEAGSLRRHVSVELDAAYQSQVEEGDEVTITLPNLKTTGGEVVSVGKVATADDEDGGAKIEVGIRPDDPEATGSLDRAPVQVSIVTGSADGVLYVPVTALLALLDGGYGVEVVAAGGARELVQVELGMFDQNSGTVEITGRGVRAGQRVVVPAS
ncbi:efflux RND transporter periplasmic adaptor subunit [Actinomadura algeriensis]|uniref:Multidrug efflux pump subunit AcrA (Membrane-fusion protein) n=1 Tax=Actinomadura algeriensis TaxID=1679523 RepID=A0ABR9JIV3_9ACTN|nr:efflux RND transporter periplasmic adaptor subunit [Actinomadura algeriensis]MBE1530481.1 multidrug efflux pump subunit AcrA (membrane-fusion protein) [Actinomadura algeriensis]